MPTETTANRAYQLPHPDNELDTDVVRLISALQAIDADVASLLVSVSQAALAGHGHIISDVSGLQAALDTKAGTGHTHAIDDLSDVNIAGAPAGRPLTTQPGGWVGIGPVPATQGDIDAAINNLVAAAPSALDTLNELAAALGDDPNFAASMTAALAGKAAVGHTHSVEDVSGLEAALGTARVPAGTVMPFAAQTPPAGWLACNGAAVSRATYADLFAVIGTAFGTGDGSTTFNLPDLRGEFVRGWDGGRGVDAGRVFGSWQDEAVGPHVHAMTNDSYTGNKLGHTVPSPTRHADANYWNWDGPVNTQLNAGTETRPRNVALLYCIKAFDVVLDPTQVSAANVIADVASNTGRITDLEATPSVLTKPPFDSGEQIITSGGPLTLPHGFGSEAKLVVGKLICKTAEYGFTAGQAIFAPLHWGYRYANTDQYGATVVSDAINIYVRYGGAPKPFIVHHWDTGTSVELTNANWRLRLWGYA